MEIKIRDVDPQVARKLSEMAKRKGVSRQEYLKVAIEKIAITDSLKEHERTIKEAQGDILQVVNKIGGQVQEMYELLFMNETEQLQRDE